MTELLLPLAESRLLTVRFATARAALWLSSLARGPAFAATTARACFPVFPGAFAFAAAGAATALRALASAGAGINSVKPTINIAAITAFAHRPNPDQSLKNLLLMRVADKGIFLVRVRPEV